MVFHVQVEEFSMYFLRLGLFMKIRWLGENLHRYPLYMTNRFEACVNYSRIQWILLSSFAQQIGIWQIWSRFKIHTLDTTHISWLLTVRSQSSFLCHTVIFRTDKQKLKLILILKIIGMKCISLQTNIITVDSVACVITSKESYYTSLNILIPDNINIHLSSFRHKVCL